MNTKIYKFSYGGTFKKFLSKIIMLFANLLLVLLIAFISLWIFGSINYGLEHYIFDADIPRIVIWIEIVLCSIVVVFFVIQPFLPQKVELYDNIIKVQRHCIIGFFRGFNDTILIANIHDICVEEDKDLGRLPKIMPVAIIDWDNLVRIEMQSGRLLYYIPVENSKEFINEVNKRRQVLHNNTEDDSLC